MNDLLNLKEGLKENIDELLFRVKIKKNSNTDQEVDIKSLFSLDNQNKLIIPELEGEQMKSFIIFFEE